MNVSTTLNIFLKPSPLTVKQLNAAMQRAAEHRDVCAQAAAVIAAREKGSDDFEIFAALEKLEDGWTDLEKFCRLKLEVK